MIDCGVLFPEEHQPGVDVILPDFTSIRDRLDDIGPSCSRTGTRTTSAACPTCCASARDIPVVGSRLTLASSRPSWRSTGSRPPMIQVSEGERHSYGPFDSSSSRSTTRSPTVSRWPSAPPPASCCTPATSRWTSSRWTGGSPTCAAFARLGEEGVDLFLTDSTNAEVPGFTTAEKDLIPAIETVFRTAPRRVIVSSFASHVHRIQQVLDAAKAHGRKAAFVGPVDGAQHGHRQGPRLPAGAPRACVDPKALESLPDDKVTLICTGSQGEPMAALARMANQDHEIQVGEDDTVLLASSLIPGNENAVYRVINGLSRSVRT